MAAMRRTIQLAISRGVPTFNTGDHMGCAMIYRACAAELLGSGQGLSHEAVAVLRSAVQDSQRGDATSAAWALREALDWCLAHSATAQRPTAPDETRVEAATIIHDAIAVGVPLFNAGDHAACADVYAEAAGRLNSLARLQLPTVTREQLTKAANASSSRPTDRAWALRKALDSCLEATAGAHAGGGGGSGSRAQSGRTGGPVVLAQPVDQPVVLAHPAEGNTLLDFTKGVGSDWQVVNDSVMGGVSRSTFGFVPQQAVSAGGHAEFSGTLSFARNGGFASVRGKLPAGACAGAVGVVLTVRGSSVPFKFCVRDRTGWESEGYQADFTPPDLHEWAELRLPFACFIPSVRGQVVGPPGSLRPDGIIGGGLMLSKLSADGRRNGVEEGQFRLEIRAVRTY